MALLIRDEKWLVFLTRNFFASAICNTLSSRTSSATYGWCSLILPETFHFKWSNSSGSYIVHIVVSWNQQMTSMWSKNVASGARGMTNLFWQKNWIGLKFSNTRRNFYNFVFFLLKETVDQKKKIRRHEQFFFRLICPKIGIRFV